LKKLFLIITMALSFFTIFVLHVPTQASAANTNVNLQAEYNEGIKTGGISKEISFEQWNSIINKNEKDLEKLKSNAIKLDKKATAYSNFSIQAGDILITDATSSYGLTGHAAIAIDHDFILDIPGLNTTTREMLASDWLNQYTAHGTVWVYRVPSAYTYVANAAATWADTHYYSTYGGAQNIFPSYGVTLATKSLNPTYCSKIVYQAYYYGSGNLPFMIPAAATVITPYGLINAFQSPYTPNLVHTY
jgi:hypothetical protein